MGVLYRGIKNHFGGKVVVEVIDPRNFILLFVLIVRQGIKNQLSCREIFHSLTKGFHTIAVFINGKLVSIGKVPELHEILLFIEKETELTKR
ncbi:hypothetical protein L1765_15065 [Microaerobacter geothermalis]|uniref:hypothetical protein n=1 Tax=Microaerobacter geothermalis TaxID=674972 RepID=UPI001F25670D|nr:hypothetical protein [Microaerobacter geothermalis]MCF6095276.1 hypothetical protein [Microaerobacter geothermalis]